MSPRERPARFPCDCCGYATLATAPTGTTMELCEVCGWEDSGDGYPYGTGWGGQNELSLEEAQRHFLAHGAAGPDFADVVRSPRPEEARAPGWRTFPERRADLIPDIERAFAGIVLGRGRSLYDGEIADGYGYEWKFLTAEHKVVEAHWEEITLEKLQSFPNGGPIVFLDPEGLRFYLPAYMRHWLQGVSGGRAEAPGQLDVHAIVFTLSLPDNASALRAILTEAQRDVVRRWLALHAGPPAGPARSDATTAKRALREGGWGDAAPATST